MKISFLTVIFIVCLGGVSFSAENITIDTKSDNFFENFISDTLLLLDSDLKEIVVSDFNYVVSESRFTPEVNNWKPKQNPAIRISNICNDIGNNNLKSSFASLVKPVVELACTSRQYDPLNNAKSDCIGNMLKYPVINEIHINYTYESNKTVEQYLGALTGLNNGNRYQQMVRATADIMNSAFEKCRKKDVVKSVNFVKYPLKQVVIGNSSGNNQKTDCTGIPGECGAGRSCVMIHYPLLGRSIGFCQYNADARQTVRDYRERQREQRLDDISDSVDRIERKLR